MLAQRALIPFGKLGSNDSDGVYGSRTTAAVMDYQSGNRLNASGLVDVETWQKLIGTIPAVAERSLEITIAFEGTGYSGVEGNFDGAGLTFGIVGFTLSNGEIGELIKRIQAVGPSLVNQAFGPLTPKLRSALALSSAKGRVAWGDSISIGKKKAGVAKPWKDAFARLGTFPEVQRVERELAHDDYFVPAEATAAKYRLTSELGLALAFDIHVQNGGIKPAAAAQITAAVTAHPITREQDLRVVIANAVADCAANIRFREDVRQRKLTVATGAGKVHDEMYVLRNWGLEDLPAD